jgi:hypothetical protein
MKKQSKIAPIDPEEELEALRQVDGFDKHIEEVMSDPVKLAEVKKDRAGHIFERVKRRYNKDFERYDLAIDTWRNDPSDQARQAYLEAAAEAWESRQCLDAAHAAYDDAFEEYQTACYESWMRQRTVK